MACLAPVSVILSAGFSIAAASKLQLCVIYAISGLGFQVFVGDFVFLLKSGIRQASGPSNSYFVVLARHLRHKPGSDSHLFIVLLGLTLVERLIDLLGR